MRRIVVAAIAVVLVVATSLLLARAHASAPEEAPVVEEPTAPPRTPDPVVFVDVSGAVAHPGVYRLPAGARVLDALLAAGGMTGDADLAALNKAAPLRDGMRIFVPRPGEAVPAGSVGSDAEQKIDINHATAAELEGLPGIGPSTAARIVRSRAARPFAKIDELQTRGLVTPRVFADIRDQVTTR
ncbi:MAG: ComEA family DNA-binding protein [Chloroflexi bacterium]|nr:MAG: ComEA family DNA-binding protein [Chloroflexota bacterium]